MICWVHGANSTSQVFNYLIGCVPEHDAIFFEYSCRNPLSENIEALTEFLKRENCTRVVGHSLGGVMGAAMMARGHADRATAIASPLGGIFAANFFPLYQLFSDVRSTSPLYCELRGHSFDESFLAIVAEGLDRGYTDGVVPLWSQRALKGVKSETFHTNHYEVVLSADVGRAISDHMFA